MPKEFIHCRDFGREVRLASSDGEDTFGTMPANAVKVGWSKESEHVELAVVQMVEGLFIEHGYLDNEAANPDERVRLAMLTPQYIQMDRNGINRLIRFLRQARDDAFGRDE